MQSQEGEQIEWDIYEQASTTGQTKFAWCEKLSSGWNPNQMQRFLESSRSDGLKTATPLFIACQVDAHLMSLIAMLLRQKANPNLLCTRYDGSSFTVLDSVIENGALDQIRQEADRDNAQSQYQLQLYLLLKSQGAKTSDEIKQEVRGAGELAQAKNLPQSFERVIGEYLTGPRQQAQRR